MIFIEVMNEELEVPEEVGPAQLELLTSSSQQDELTRGLLLDQAGFQGDWLSNRSWLP